MSNQCWHGSFCRNQVHHQIIPSTHGFRAGYMHYARWIDQNYWRGFQHRGIPTCNAGGRRASDRQWSFFTAAAVSSALGAGGQLIARPGRRQTVELAQKCWHSARRQFRPGRHLQGVPVARPDWPLTELAELLPGLCRRVLPIKFCASAVGLAPQADRQTAGGNLTFCAWIAASHPMGVTESFPALAGCQPDAHE